MSRGFNSIQLAAPQTTEWTREATAAYGRFMGRGDHSDPLDNPQRERRWLVVRNMHNAILTVRPLPPETDLRRTFIQAMLEWTDAGFHIAEFSSRAGVFFGKNAKGERHMVEITPADCVQGRGRALP
jgi:hypothetical protein